jgi:hypothetical protein
MDELTFVSLLLNVTSERHPEMNGTEPVERDGLMDCADPATGACVSLPREVTGVCVRVTRLALLFYFARLILVLMDEWNPS